MAKPASDTRQQILSAALKQFADQGYAGTSVQEIVAAARVTKPTLYYYFGSKAGLYGALIAWAHDERLRLMRAAADRGVTLAEKLTEILAATFEFVRHNRELTRLAFATTFSARGEAPKEANCLEKGRRNFEYIHELIKVALATKGLDRHFGSEELAMGVYGMMSFHVMVHLVMPERTLDRRMAERIVKLFLSGAAVKTRS